MFWWALFAGLLNGLLSWVRRRLREMELEEASY